MEGTPLPNAGQRGQNRTKAPRSKRIHKGVDEHGSRGRKGARNVTRGDREHILRLFTETGNMAEVARRTGWAYSTVCNVIKAANLDKNSFIPDVEMPPPKRWNELDEQEKGWLTDFKAFRQHFFRRDTPPFHTQIASAISSREHNKILVLCPPGFGKTQAFSIDLPIWEMIRARVRNDPQGWACMLISKSDKMAMSFLSQIRRELEQNVELQRHYGRFKPEFPDHWSRDKATVEGFPIRKEPTFITAGARSHIYGWRVHLIVGDDIVDSENSGTPEAADKLANWYADELESRLEPGGVIADVGTRFSGFDLHGKLWRLRDDRGDQIYHPIIYKAHDETTCTGVHCMECREQCTHDQPWPDGCTLWPARFSYRKLRQRRSSQTSAARFEFVYNQVEVAVEGALVKPEWVKAALDKDRVAWVVPSACRVMCTLDPSPTKWAVAQAWAYNQAEDMRYAVAMHRRLNMQAPAYVQLIREWTLKLRGMGAEPIWVVEINAAQRWLLQSTDYQRMREEIGVVVLPHTTHRNKADPLYGVQCIGPAWEFHKVNIPNGDPESRQMFAPLLDELQAYPDSTTDDCVMAEWFFEHHLRRFQYDNLQRFSDVPDMPPYLMQTREMVDLRTGHHMSVSN